METIRLLDGPEELEARWTEIWPHIRAFEEHHARILGRQLKDGREAYNRASLSRKLGGQNYWFQVAEENGAIVGIGSVQILGRGVTVAQPVGYVGLVYIEPLRRGTGLNQRMFDARSQVLRNQGIRIRESSRYRDNGRIESAWRGEVWGYSLRRPTLQDIPDPAVDVRRVKNLDEDWPALWTLLRSDGNDDKAAAHLRLEQLLEHRGAAFLAADGSGLITGQISVNPWMFVERVGAIHDLVVTRDAAEATAEALLGRLERWMVGKEATAIQTRPLPLAEADAWTARGFDPYMFQRHHVIQP